MVEGSHDRNAAQPGADTGAGASDEEHNSNDETARLDWSSVAATPELAASILLTRLEETLADNVALRTQLDALRSTPPAAMPPDLRTAAEDLADAVEDYLITTAGSEDEVRDAWRRYVDVADVLDEQAPLNISDDPVRLGAIKARIAEIATEIGEADEKRARDLNQEAHQLMDEVEHVHKLRPNL